MASKSIDNLNKGTSKKSAGRRRFNLGRAYTRRAERLTSHPGVGSGNASVGSHANPPALGINFELLVPPMGPLAKPLAKERAYNPNYDCLRAVRKGANKAHSLEAILRLYDGKPTVKGYNNLFEVEVALEAIGYIADAAIILSITPKKEKPMNNNYEQTRADRKRRQRRNARHAQRHQRPMTAADYQRNAAKAERREQRRMIARIERQERLVSKGVITQETRNMCAPFHSVVKPFTKAQQRAAAKKRLAFERPMRKAPVPTAVDYRRRYAADGNYQRKLDQEAAQRALNHGWTQPVAFKDDKPTWAERPSQPAPILGMEDVMPPSFLEAAKQQLERAYEAYPVPMEGMLRPGVNKGNEQETPTQSQGDPMNDICEIIVANGGQLAIEMVLNTPEGADKPGNGQVCVAASVFTGEDEDINNTYYLGNSPALERETKASNLEDCQKTNVVVTEKGDSTFSKCDGNLRAVTLRKNKNGELVVVIIYSVFTALQVPFLAWSGAANGRRPVSAWRSMAGYSEGNKTFNEGDNMSILPALFNLNEKGELVAMYGKHKAQPVETATRREQIHHMWMTGNLPADGWDENEVDTQFKAWLDQGNAITVHHPLEQYADGNDRKLLLTVAKVYEYVDCSQEGTRQVRVMAKELKVYMISKEDLAKLYHHAPAVTYPKSSAGHWPLFPQPKNIPGTKNRLHDGMSMTPQPKAKATKAVQTPASAPAPASSLLSKVMIEQEEPMPAPIAKQQAPRPVIDLDLDYDGLGAESEAVYGYYKEQITKELKEAQEVNASNYRSLAFAKQEAGMTIGEGHGAAMATCAFAYMKACAKAQNFKLIRWDVSHLLYVFLLLGYQGQFEDGKKFSEVCYFMADGIKISTPKEFDACPNVERLTLYIQDKAMFVFLLDNGKVDFVICGNEVRGRAIRNTMLLGYIQGENKKDKLLYKAIPSFNNFMWFLGAVILPLIANSFGAGAKLNPSLGANIEKAIDILDLSSDQVETADAGSQYVIKNTFSLVELKATPVTKTNRKEETVWVVLPKGAKSIKAVLDHARKFNVYSGKRRDIKAMMDAAVQPVLEKYGLDVRFTNAEFVSAGMSSLTLDVIKTYAPKHYARLCNLYGADKVGANDVLALGTKLSKGVKRFLLKFGEGAPALNPVKSGWTLPGQPAIIEGSLTKLMVGPAMCGFAGGVYWIDNGIDLPPTAVVSKTVDITKDNFIESDPLDFMLTGLKGGHDVGWELTQDKGWFIYTPTGKVSMTHGDIICKVKVSPETNPFVDVDVVHELFTEGVVTQVRARIKVSVAGTKSLEIQYDYFWTEDNGKIRSIIKGQMLHADAQLIFNKLNPSLAGCDINLVVPSDSWKGDVSYTWVIVAANQVRYNMDSTDPRMVALREEAMKLNASYGYPNDLEDFTVYICPMGVVSGVYTKLVQLFVDIYLHKEAIWVNWSDATAQARIVDNIYTLHWKEGNIEDFPEVQKAFKGYTFKVLVENKDVTDMYTNVFVMLYKNGELVGYLQRTYVLCGQPGLPMYNVEVYESSTVVESSSSSRIRLAEAAGMGMISTETHTAQIECIKKGFPQTMRLKAITSMVNGALIDESLKVFSFKCYATSSDGEEYIDVDTISLGGSVDPNDLIGDFKDICKRFEKNIFKFDLAPNKSFTIWLPLLPQFNQLKSCSCDDNNFVKKFFEVFKLLATGQQVKVVDIKSVYNLMCSYLDSEKCITLMHGGENATAKRIAHPGLPVARIGVLVDDRPNSQWQILIRNGVDVKAALNGKHIKLAGHRAPLSSGYIGILQPIEQITVSHTKDGEIVDTYQVFVPLEGDRVGFDRRQMFSISAFQIATDVFCPVAFDGGDWDGDGFYITEVDDSAPVSTWKDGEKMLESFLGQNIWKVKGQYFTDHYAVKPKTKALMILQDLKSAMADGLSTYEKYTNYTSQAVQIQHNAVGMAYASYMMGAIGAHIANTLKDNGIKVAGLSRIEQDIKVGVITASMYEFMLGGFDESAVLYKDILKTVSGNLKEGVESTALNPETVLAVMEGMSTAPKGATADNIRVLQAYDVLTLTAQYYAFNKGAGALYLDKVVNLKNFDMHSTEVWARFISTILDMQRGEFIGFFGAIRKPVENDSVDGDSESTEFKKWRGQAYNLAVSINLLAHLKHNYPGIIERNVYLYAFYDLYMTLFDELLTGKINYWYPEHVEYYMPSDKPTDDTPPSGGSPVDNTPVNDGDDDGDAATVEVESVEVVEDAQPEEPTVEVVEIQPEIHYADLEEVHNYDGHSKVYILDGTVYYTGFPRVETTLENDGYWSTDESHPSSTNDVGVCPAFALKVEDFPNEVIEDAKQGWTYLYVGKHIVKHNEEEVMEASEPVNPELALLKQLQAQYGDLNLSQLIEKLAPPVAAAQDVNVEVIEPTIEPIIEESMPVVEQIITEEIKEINPLMSTLTDEQIEVVENVIAGRNIFLTGKGGAGKSYTVEVIRKVFDEAGYPYIVTGSTGTSVVNIDGHGTVNGIFGLKLGFEDENVQGGFKKHELQRSLSQYLTLMNKAANAPRLRSFMADNLHLAMKHNRKILIIVDEISMMDSLIMSAIQEAVDYKRYRIQWLLVGDPCQFKPVNGHMFFKNVVIYDRYHKENIEKKSILNQPELDFVCYNLTKNMRASGDQEWADALDMMRMGKGAGLALPGVINDRWEYSMTHTAPEDAMHLAYTNFTVQKYNQIATDRLIESGAEHKTYVGRVYTKHQYGKTPDSWLYKYNKNDITVTKFAPIDINMTYCVGMRVMMRELNIYEGNKLLINNGAIGTVLELRPHSVLVKFDSGVVYDVKAHTFQEGQNSFTQIPLAPAYALTFNKCQGMTLNVPVVIHLYMELLNGTVMPLKEENAAYVALSRLTTSKNCYFHTHFTGDADEIKQLAINSYKCSREAVKFLSEMK